MLFHQAEPKDKAIECGFPAAIVAHQLRDLLERELPNLNALDPPLIRDTVFDEQGIYAWTPVELSQTQAGYQVNVRGSVSVWNGTEYVPDGQLTDLLTVELFDNDGASLAIVKPAFDAFRGFAEHVEALITHNWGVERGPEPADVPKESREEQLPDSGHYKYPPQERQQIVEEYRDARRRGQALNKDAWARSRWDICGKTLLKYEKEFPAEES